MGSWTLKKLKVEISTQQEFSDLLDNYQVVKKDVFLSFYLVSGLAITASLPYVFHTLDLACKIYIFQATFNIPHGFKMHETYPWRWEVENYEVQIILSVCEISRIVS
jgi:hypothetical protein